MDTHRGTLINYYQEPLHAPGATEVTPSNYSRDNVRQRREGKVSPNGSALPNSIMDIRSNEGFKSFIDRTYETKGATNHEYTT